MNNAGVVSAGSAFIMWGLLPIYWKLLDAVPAYEILCHRMIWSLALTLLLLALIGRLRGLVSLLREKRQFFYFLLTGAILGVNWFIYIWAVNADHIIEASLGYFINPLVSVCFGVLFLHEKIRPLQWFCVVLAATGVVYLTILYGQFPWIALSLASTFACYGLLHKITTVPPLEGLSMETCMLFLPAAGCLVVFELTGRGSFGHGGIGESMLLVGTGVATTAPLLCFCYAAQKIPLYLVGLLQYLAPTINLFVGIFLYHEPFPLERMAGFAFIWTALVIFIFEGLHRQLRLHRAAVKVGKRVEGG